MTERFFTPQTAAQHIGETFISDWLTVDQQRINLFGEVTEDADPHHVDPEFCKEHSPWGKPIAFGFLTISLLTTMMYPVCRYPLDGDPADGYPANYGFNKLRLVESVPVDSRIRGHFTVKDVRMRKPGQQLMILAVTVEIEGNPRPALVAEWESLWITP